MLILLIFCAFIYVAYTKLNKLVAAFIARCCAERGYEIACRLSVWPSVCDVKVPWSHMLEFFLYCSIVTNTLSPKDFKLSRFKWIRVTTLTNVVDHVPIRLAVCHVISYRCSTDTDPLDWTVFDILSFKCCRVTAFTFQYHVTSPVTWPFDSHSERSGCPLPAGTVNLVHISNIKPRMHFLIKSSLTQIPVDGGKRKFYPLLMFRGWLPRKDVIWTMNSYNWSIDDVGHVFQLICAATENSLWGANLG